MDPSAMMGGMGSMPPGGPLESIMGGGNTPYAHGYGMGAPGPFQGYQSSTGIQNPMGYGDPNRGGGDLTQRGIGENFFGANAHAYGSPSMSEFYSANALNRYSGGTPQGSTNQAENYGRFAASRPDIAAEPGLGAYYDRAVQRASTDINNQLAARGMYGSSWGACKTPSLTCVPTRPRTRPITTFGDWASSADGKACKDPLLVQPMPIPWPILAMS